MLGIQIANYLLYSKSNSLNKWFKFLYFCPNFLCVLFEVCHNFFLWLTFIFERFLMFTNDVKSLNKNLMKELIKEQLLEPISSEHHFQIFNKLTSFKFWRRRFKIKIQLWWLKVRLHVRFQLLKIANRINL